MPRSSNAGGEAPRLSGARLREQRQARYLSVTELGFRIGRSADTIRAYESGAVVPPSDILAALVHELGCTFDDVHVFASAS